MFNKTSGIAFATRNKISCVVMTFVVIVAMLASSVGLSKALYYPPESVWLRPWGQQFNGDGNHVAFTDYSRSQGSRLMTGVDSARFANAHPVAYGLDPDMANIVNTYPPLQKRNGQTTVEFKDNRLETYRNIEYGFVPSGETYGVASGFYRHHVGTTGITRDSTFDQLWSERTDPCKVFTISPTSVSFRPGFENTTTLENIMNDGWGTTPKNQLIENSNIMSTAGQNFYNDHKTSNSVRTWEETVYKQGSTVKDSGFRGMFAVWQSTTGLPVVEKRFITAGEPAETNNLTINGRYRESQPGVVAPRNNTLDPNVNYQVYTALTLGGYTFDLAKINNMSIYDYKSNTHVTISALVRIKNIIPANTTNTIDIALSKDLFSTGFLNPSIVTRYIKNYDLEILYYNEDGTQATLKNNLSYGSVDAQEEISFYDTNRQNVNYIVASPDTTLSYSYQRPVRRTSGDKAHIFTATTPSVSCSDISQGYTGHNDQRFLVSAFMTVSGASIVNYQTDAAGYVFLSQYATPFGMPTYAPLTTSKYVSDNNETGVTTNALSLPTEEFRYDIQCALPIIDPGDNFSTLEISDELAKILSVSLGAIKIYDDSDTDVTNKFDISIDSDNKLVALTKPSETAWLNTYRWGEGFKLQFPATINWGLDASEYEPYITNNTLKITNKAETRYKTTTETDWSYVSTSNETLTTLNITPNLKISKTASKYEYHGSEEIEYTLDIYNDSVNYGSLTLARNVNISDTVPSVLKLVDDSVTFSSINTITNMSISVTGNNIAVNIPRLYAKDITSLASITFKTVPVSLGGIITANGNIVNNFATVTCSDMSTKQSNDTVYINSPVPKITKEGIATTHGGVYNISAVNEKEGTVGWGNITLTDILSTSGIVKSLDVTGVWLTIDGDRTNIIEDTELIDSLVVNTTDKSIDLILDKDIILVNSDNDLPPTYDDLCPSPAAFDLANYPYVTTKIELEYEVSLKAKSTHVIDIDNIVAIGFGKNTEGVDQTDTDDDEHFLPLEAKTNLSLNKTINDQTDDILGVIDFTYHIGDFVPYKLEITNIGEQSAFDVFGVDFVTRQGLRLDKESVKAIKKTPIEGEYGRYISEDVTSNIGWVDDFELIANEDVLEYINSLDISVADINTMASVIFYYEGVLEETQSLEFTYELEIIDEMNSYMTIGELLRVDNFAIASSVNTEEPPTDTKDIDIDFDTKLEVDKKTDTNIAYPGSEVPYTIDIINTTSTKAIQVVIKDEIQTTHASVVPSSIKLTYITSDTSVDITTGADIEIDGNTFVVKTNSDLVIGDILRLNYKILLGTNLEQGISLKNIANAWADNAEDPEDSDTIKIPAPKPIPAPKTGDKVPIVLLIGFVLLLLACLIGAFVMEKRAKKNYIDKEKGKR